MLLILMNKAAKDVPDAAKILEHTCLHDNPASTFMQLPRTQKAQHELKSRPAWQSLNTQLHRKLCIFRPRGKGWTEQTTDANFPQSHPARKTWAA